MCGIFGYMGNSNAQSIIHHGLKRLEYRGYDSWGISVIEDGKIHTDKNTGEIPKQYIPQKSSNIGIGHTRWATHGGVTITNAHPHYSSDMSFSLAQNGIVENYISLKTMLIKNGYTFSTEVDTEVIVKLIEDHLSNSQNLKQALISSFKQLEGRNTVILLDSKSNQIYAIRNGSPLILGIGEEDIYIASDPLAFNQYCKKIVEIDNGELVEIEYKQYKIFDISNNKYINRVPKSIDYLDTEVSKGIYDDYMIKEIIEQKHTILTATQYTQKDLLTLITQIKKSNTVYTIGAGTAGYSADQVAYYLRKISNIKAISVKPYEIESYIELIDKDDTVLAFSQSGETADTLEVIETLKQKGTYISSVINMPSSTLERLSDSVYMSNAGSEICVASTKVFTSQISFGYLLAMCLADKYSLAKKELSTLSSNLEIFFSKQMLKKIENISKELVKQEHFFILGKGQNFHIAQEGALKIKEISYKHFEGFAAGELKHGVIALIEKGTPVISIISNDENKKDLISATQQVKARGALTIGIGDKQEENCFDFFIEVPDTDTLKSISNVIPLQLLSYYISKKLGNNIDKPRNLAKSVTVK